MYTQMFCFIVHPLYDQIRNFLQRYFYMLYMYLNLSLVYYR